MKYLFRAVALLAGIAAPAQASEWWWVGLNGEAPNRVMTYVDRETIFAKDGAVEVWALAAGETALADGQQYQATRYALKCRAGTFTTLKYIKMDRALKTIRMADLPPGRFAPVPKGSIAESIALVACGRMSGSEVRVDSPNRHAADFLAGRNAPGSGQPEGAPEGSGLSIGTGFFIGPEGHILTSYHVIEGGRRLACRTADGRILDAKLTRMSPANDLALLKVELRPARYLGFAPAGSLRPGDRVFTIGYGAAGFLGVNEPRFTDGTVSALSGIGAEDAYMQISVPVQPGNSGGPLVNEAGQVVGIIAAQAAIDTFMEVEGTLPQNINWAVKSDYASPLLSPLAATPRRTREQAIDLVRNSVCLVMADKREQ